MRYVIGLTTATLALVLMGGPALNNAGAQTTGEKIEKKAEDLKDKTKSAAKDAKTGVTDSWVTAKTKIALFADDRVKGRQVHIDTKDGVVSLRGVVDTAEAKAAAAEVAKGIEGVKSVRNDLQVVKPADQKMVSVADKDLAQQVQSRLQKDAQLKASKIDVRVDGGVVTLKGEVQDIGQSARASEVARQVAGVRSVKNELDVQMKG